MCHHCCFVLPGCNISTFDHTSKAVLKDRTVSLVGHRHFHRARQAGRATFALCRLGSVWRKPSHLRTLQECVRSKSSTCKQKAARSRRSTPGRFRYRDGLNKFSAHRVLRFVRQRRSGFLHQVSRWQQIPPSQSTQSACRIFIADEHATTSRGR